MKEGKEEGVQGIGSLVRCHLHHEHHDPGWRPRCPPWDTVQQKGLGCAHPPTSPLKQPRASYPASSVHPEKPPPFQVKKPPPSFSEKLDGERQLLVPLTSQAWRAPGEAAARAFQSQGTKGFMLLLFQCVLPAACKCVLRREGHCR